MLLQVLRPAEFRRAVIEQNLLPFLLISLVGLLLMLLLEPLFQHVFATTPGKFLYGFYLYQLGTPTGDAGPMPNRQKLTLAQALRRTWLVLAKGLGFSIPIYRIFRLVKSYNACVDDYFMEWDREVRYQALERVKWTTVVAYVLLVLLFSVLQAWVTLRFVR